MKIIVLILVLAIAAGAGYYYYQQSLFPIYIDLKESHGFQKGDLVTLKGVGIGKITNLVVMADRVRFTVLVDKNARTAIRSDSTFIPKTENARRELLGVVVDPNSPQAVKGQVFTGCDTEYQLIKRTGVKRLKEWWSEFASSPAVEELKKSIEKAQENIPD